MPKGTMNSARKILCQECKNEFETFLPGAKYCSTKCMKIFSKRYFRNYKKRDYVKVKMHGKHILKEYGITNEKYDSILESQNGGCAICTRKDTGIKNQKWFHVDHDHSSKIVRGILCSRCNAGIAMFDHAPELLIEAAKYVLIGEEVISES